MEDSLSIPTQAEVCYETVEVVELMVVEVQEGLAVVVVVVVVVM